MALDEASVEHRIVTYEGAPHSFFDHKQAAHTEASLEAWSEVREFVAAYAS